MQWIEERGLQGYLPPFIGGQLRLRTILSLTKRVETLQGEIESLTINEYTGEMIVKLTWAAKQDGKTWVPTDNLVQKVYLVAAMLTKDEGVIKVVNALSCQVGELLPAGHSDTITQIVPA